MQLAIALGTTPTALLGRESAASMHTIGVPPSLRTFAANTSVPEVDVEMLAQIHYRGKQPESAEDWAHIYETIKRTIR